MTREADAVLLTFLKRLKLRFIKTNPSCFPPSIEKVSVNMERII